MQYLVLFIVADDDIYIFLSFLEMNDLISNFKSNQIKSDQIKIKIQKDKTYFFSAIKYIPSIL